jgi:hypothetical protein
VEVFHKPDGYDPQRDGSVRQHIGKLRQKLEEYYRSEGVMDQIHVELPKRQFRPVFQDSKPDLKTERRFTAWAAPIGLVLEASSGTGSDRSAILLPPWIWTLRSAPFGNLSGIAPGQPWSAWVLLCSSGTGRCEYANRT